MRRSIWFLDTTAQTVWLMCETSFSLLLAARAEANILNDGDVSAN